MGVYKTYTSLELGRWQWYAKPNRSSKTNGNGWLGIGNGFVVYGKIWTDNRFSFLIQTPSCHGAVTRSKKIISYEENPKQHADLLKQRASLMGGFFFIYSSYVSQPIQSKIQVFWITTWFHAQEQQTIHPGTL